MDKSVTISCRVTPDIKMQLTQRSEKLGMKLCNYIELLVLNQFEIEQQGNAKTITENNTQENQIEPNFQALFTQLSDDATQATIFEKHLDILQEKHENSTEVELVNACLIHAVTNDKALWQRNLSVFLNRLKEGEYDN
jgi:glutathionylspermidine synthase